MGRELDYSENPITASSVSVPLESERHPARLGLSFILNHYLSHFSQRGGGGINVNMYYYAILHAHYFLAAVRFHAFK